MARVDDAAAPGAPQRIRLFYDHLVGEAEVREVFDLQGIDHEIALLRLRLREHLHEHAEDYELMLKSVGSIVRAVSTRYRIGDKRTKDLSNAMVAVLDAVGEQFDQVAAEVET